MKLKEFSEKPIIKRTSSPFIIQNEVAENKHKAQIDTLNKELGYYRHLEAERDEALAKFAQINEKNIACEREISSVNEKLQAVRETMDSQQAIVEKLPVLEEELNNYKGQLGSKNNELEVMTKTAFEQSSNLSLLGRQVEGLQNENIQLVQDESQARADKLSAEEEAKGVLVKNIELQTFAVETGKINKKVEKDYSEIRDERNFWEKEAQESQIQLNEAIQVESKLRKWVTDLEKIGSDDSVHKGELNKEVTVLQLQITDMSKVMEDLLKELKYLREVNSQYRKELAKPRYLSMGAIAKQEGFKMPIGKENIRTHNLGNAVPTLLKFRTEEESNGK